MMADGHLSCGEFYTHRLCVRMCVCAYMHCVPINTHLVYRAFYRLCFSLLLICCLFLNSFFASHSQCPMIFVFAMRAVPFRFSCVYIFFPFFSHFVVFDIVVCRWLNLDSFFFSSFLLVYCIL